MHNCQSDVAIIGAGPYGLSLAHHLERRGITRRIFGDVMSFWRQMPAGMFLKSFGFATSIPSVDGSFTLPQYCRSFGLEDQEPIAIGTFASYGLDFQTRFVPDLVPASVTLVRRTGAQFELKTETGDTYSARCVIVATGLSYFETIAPQLLHLPSERVSHSGWHQTFTPFAGRDVTVIGGGQSALQAAALLHEAGAQTRIVTRDRVVWNTRMPLNRSWLERLRNPNTVLGAGRKNWLLQHAPSLFPWAPEEKRIRFTRGHLGPAGAWWLKDRVCGVVTTQERAVVIRALSRADGLRLDIRDANGVTSTVETEHVIAGTGYEVDIDRLPFLSRDLRDRIARTVKAPRLSRYFESSEAGLYFVGPAAAFSFGPLSRFVSGASFTSTRLVRHLSNRLLTRHVWVTTSPNSPEPTRVQP